MSAGGEVREGLGSGRDAIGTGASEGENAHAGCNEVFTRQLCQLKIDKKFRSLYYFMQTFS
jgi:hypothetical protein